MDPEITGIIGAVVTALGETVATDAWTGFKTLLSRILGRDNGAEIASEQEQLDRDRDKIIAARQGGDNDRLSRIDAKWSERLLDFIEENPDRIDALRELVATYREDEQSGLTASQTVNNRNTAHDNSRIISGGIGDVNVTLPRGE